LRAAPLRPAAVDLVEDDEARHVVRADLGQHFLGHRDLPPEPASLASTTWRSSDASSASSSVDLNEATSPCGRFLMKPTVSLTRHARDGFGMQRPHRGIERREELVRDQSLASRQRAHQGGLARIRVSDERHAGETLALPPPGALRLVLEGHSVELLLQLGDAVADLAPVELAVRFAAAASPVPLRPRSFGPASLAASRMRGAM